VLLAPARIEDVGAVGDREVRSILAALRQSFDLVLVDCGSHVTPVSAAAVETADELVLVATPDVLALRGVHRAVDTWSRLGVRKSEQVRLLLNRTSRSSELQPEAAARLVPTEALRTTLPASFKHLEPGLNHRSPAEVRQKAWWRAVDSLAAELGLAPGARATGGGRGRRVRGDAGQAALEFVGVFPLVLLLAVLVWQVALWAAMAGLSGHAASEGARAAAVAPLSAAQLRQEAVGSVPSWFRGGMDVSRSGDQVVVRAELPVLFPGVGTDGLVFTSRAVVVEG
jgi:pilus assembly protein CpaE